MPTLSLILDGTPETISLASVAIQGLCNYLEIPGRDCCRIDFAVTEALNNIVQHGYKSTPLPSDGEAIRIIYCYDHHKITISLVDQGVDYSASAHGAIALPELNQENGRGWPIIRQCADHLWYERQNDRNILVLEFLINPPPS